MAIRHGVKDSDKHFIIDPVTRTVKNESGKLVLIQYDHNSERFTFECPRFVDDHDMSLCNRVEIHYINTGANSKSTGIYEVDDLQISSETNTVTCSWLVSQNATQHVGKLNFIIRFACIAEDSTIEYAWNTSIYSDIVISKGIYNGEEFIEDYVDVLETWKQDLYSEGLKIESITQTVTSTEDSGINVITITMTDGSKKTFQIQNGSKGSVGDPGTSIKSIERTAGNGLPGSTDTYTVTLTDGSTSTFQVYNGKDGQDGQDGEDGKDGSSISDITRTSGDGSPGTIDTYTITLTNGSTTTFQVYNGANGADGDGSGDMTEATYDPHGKRTDIFKYVDDKVGEIEIPDSILLSDSVESTSSETAASSAAVKKAYDKAVEAAEAAAGSSDNTMTDDEFKALLETALASSPNITIKKDGGMIKLESADGTKYFSMSEGGYVVVDSGKIASLMPDSLQFVGTEGKVTGLGVPTDDNHAANKGYVDTTIHSGITTAGTGAAYTATVSGISSLVRGVSFVMIPHTASTTIAPTLDVNNLGAKPIKRRTSTVTSSLGDGYADSWLGSGAPIYVIYDGTYWVIQGMEKPNVHDLSGAVPVAKGGTGYQSIEDTAYTTARYRASALVEAETEPDTNGVINWTYE